MTLLEDATPRLQGFPSRDSPQRFPITCSRANLLICVTHAHRFKLIKYGKGTKRLFQLSLAVESAGPDIFNFAVIFAACASGFSFSAVILFSDELGDYATFLGAMGRLMNAIFGNFDTSQLYMANRVVGVPFMYLWLLLSNTLLLNFCIAILSHHYSSCTRDVPSGRTVELARMPGGSIAPDDVHVQSLLPIADEFSVLNGQVLKPLGEAQDVYSSQMAVDTLRLSSAPRKGAWEEQDGAGGASGHWQLVQLLEDIKLSINRLSEAHEATNARVEFIADKVERLSSSRADPSWSLPGAVRGNPGDPSDDEADPAGASGQQSKAQGNLNESARSRARIGGMAGKSLAPDKDA